MQSRSLIETLSTHLSTGVCVTLTKKVYVIAHASWSSDTERVDISGSLADPLPLIR